MEEIARSIKNLKNAAGLIQENLQEDNKVVDRIINITAKNLNVLEAGNEKLGASGGYSYAWMVIMFTILLPLMTMFILVFPKRK